MNAEDRVRAFIDEWDRLAQHDEQIHSIQTRAGSFTLTTTDIREVLDAPYKDALYDGPGNTAAGHEHWDDGR